MRRPRRTPSTTPESIERPSSPRAAGADPRDHFILPETVQQASRANSNNNNGVGAMAPANVGPMRRRKRGSSNTKRRSLLFQLRRWLFSSPKSKWDDPLRGGGGGLSSASRGNKKNNSVRFPIVGLLSVLAICLFCMYRVMMSAQRPTTSIDATRPRFLSGPVSVLAAKPFKVSFDIDPADVVKSRWFVGPKPLTAWDRVEMKQRDFGGLQIRFFEEVGLRQQKRVIYHDFQDEWGVAKLKSGPNDGV